MRLLGLLVDADTLGIPGGGGGDRVADSETGTDKTTRSIQTAALSW